MRTGAPVNLSRFIIVRREITAETAKAVLGSKVLGSRDDALFICEVPPKSGELGTPSCT
jgi:hypothetical protein